MEQEACIIKFQDVRFAAKLRGVVDAHTVLDERFVATGIRWFTGIDRYLKEGAASAPQGFQRYREYRTPSALEMIAQFLRKNRTHFGLPRPFQPYTARRAVRPVKNCGCTTGHSPRGKP
jgi:hypothetical protein